MSKFVTGDCVECGRPLTDPFVDHVPCGTKGLMEVCREIGRRGEIKCMRIIRGDTTREDHHDQDRQTRQDM